MHEPFLWNLLFSFTLHLRFYQTHHDELVGPLHSYYIWLVHQNTLGPYTKFLYLNLANAFILLNLRVAGVNFV